EQVAALTGGPVSARVAAELYLRAEGNPFFTEQLVAAALNGEAGAGELSVPAGLPARLAELLVARAARCAGDARAVLAGLAGAGRAPNQGLLGAGSRRGTQGAPGGARGPGAAPPPAGGTPARGHPPPPPPRADGGRQPRPSLLGEAVAAGLLPGERAALHERTARALAEAGDRGLPAEVAGHWQAAGDPARELPVRVAAARTAERVFGYAQAAVHWQRSIELGQEQPDGVATVAGIEVPRLYVRAIDALYMSGDSEGAAAVAEEAYRRFAGHPDPATAAVICHCAAYYRAIEAPDAGLPFMEEGLRPFRPAPPSFDHAHAFLPHPNTFPPLGHGRGEATAPPLYR